MTGQKLNNRKGSYKINWLAQNESDHILLEPVAIDVMFELDGNTIPVDHGHAIFLQLCTHLPWLEAEEHVGIHAIRGALTGTGELILNRRARLMLRVPMQRIQDTLKLSGKTLELGGHALIIGPGRTKPLLLHSPLYASCVTTGSATETDFAADVIRLLKNRDIDTRFVCGRRRAMETANGKQYGYSLLLHGLQLEHVIQLQETGLGGNRKIGCGIFVPHKSISALE